MTWPKYDSSKEQTPRQCILKVPIRVLYTDKYITWFDLATQADGRSGFPRVIAPNYRELWKECLQRKSFESGTFNASMRL